MITYVIEGGQPLKGEYLVSGSRSTACKLLIASLLTPEPVIIKNIPHTQEVEATADSLQFLGAKINWTSPEEIQVECKKLNGCAISVEALKKCPANFLFWGSLIGRLHKAAVPDPTDNKINQHPVDRHLHAAIKLGIKVKKTKGFFQASGQTQGKAVQFKKHTQMGTENLILMSVLGNGKVIINNAAEEPEVDNLINMLNSMGALIERTGPRKIEIQGVKKLSGTSVEVIGDRKEAVAVACAAAATRGEVLIKGFQTTHITKALAKFKQAGIQYKVSDEGLLVWAYEQNPFNPLEIESRPHPEFSTIWIPYFTTLCTQANGESTLHDTIYPNRFGFVDLLVKMGAEIHPHDPDLPDPESAYAFNIKNRDPSLKQAVKIFGPAPLVGTKLNSENLKDKEVLIFAALAAKGTSEIQGIEDFNKDLPFLVKKLKSLGAKIEQKNPS
ncbi:hypothetical protein B5M47_02470 [candidate division CPR3 bacterium 4484_211]|uniref:UDP-N-acetylglucosamine 1-carboxyvinyltransferase n=1 Tax=candidate division CPR3 bacterium 4484_211 TaxID=1968527 RepID=A0A1W9NXS1_UNCC3|nr:MAG: hypothetical protein B5M47_02470 [candidate division CPR3 bacterium 4484_211]